MILFEKYNLDTFNLRSLIAGFEVSFLLHETD